MDIKKEFSNLDELIMNLTLEGVAGVIHGDPERAEICREIIAKLCQIRHILQDNEDKISIRGGVKNGNMDY